MMRRLWAWLCDVLGGSLRDRDLGEETHLRAYVAAAVMADLFVLAVQVWLCARFTGPQLSDAQSYLELALYCAENHVGYPGPRDMFAIYIFGNGYVNLLSWLMRIAPSMVWVYLINIVSTQVIILSTAAIAYAISGRKKTACIAAILLCLMPGIWGEAVSARTELLFMALAMASLALMMTRRTFALFAAGICMALCNWVRPLLIIYLPAIIVYFLMRRVRLRGIAAYMAAMLLVIALVGMDAKSRTGEFIFQAQTMGVNMLMGANDDADGSYVSAIYDEGKVGHVPPGSGLTFMERDAQYKASAVEWIKAHPVRFLSLIPAKLFYYLATDTYGGSAFFNNEKSTDNLAYIKELVGILTGRGERAFMLGDAVVLFEQAMYMLVAVLYVISIVDGVRKRYIADLLPLHIIFALSCGVTILTVGGARYHLPYLPFFCLCAAAFISAKRRRGQGVKSLAGFGAGPGRIL